MEGVVIAIFKSQKPPKENQPPSYAIFICPVPKDIQSAKIF